MSFADVIAKDRGQPANVRIGVVTSVSPLLINVQGTLFRDVGVLNGYLPRVNDVVALLGQSAISADAASWLVLGRVLESASGIVLSGTVFSAADLITVSTASLVYVPLTGSFNVGIAFQAPASGSVVCSIRSSIAPAATAAAWMSVRLGTGSTIGAGTLVAAASDNYALMMTVSAFGLGGDVGIRFPFTGLTPGATYNFEAQHRTSLGTSFWSRRQIIVDPVV